MLKVSSSLSNAQKAIVHLYKLGKIFLKFTLNKRTLNSTVFLIFKYKNILIGPKLSNDSNLFHSGWVCNAFSYLP